MAISTYLSIITSNFNGLNSLIKSSGKLWKETASMSYCPHDRIQLYLKGTYKELGYTTKVELANVVSDARVSLLAV